MAAAVAQAQGATGVTATWVNAETGISFNLADNLTDTTTPVAIPTATGTTFSWIKNLVLAVTTAGTTTISNRRINMSGATATGLQLFWQAVAVASYAQAASGNRPASTGVNGSTPAGYTLMTTTPVVYDAAAVVSSSTGPNGKMAVTCIGVDFGFLGGPGSATALPSITLTYDEA